jgi:hypothetical protein
MPLEDESAGYVCQSLDLGWPDVRDVTSNRPDADGIEDRTRYMGGRTVSADVTALAGAGAVIDEVASAFGPFMVPSARPVLHYVLDRPGATERTLTLRSSGYEWPIAGPFERDIQLQWVAADPVARDPVVQSATAWAGTGILGRVYNLVFPRVYPVGANVPTLGQIVGHGEVPIKPYLRIYGPITAPHVSLRNNLAPIVQSNIWLTSRIDAGHFVGIDTLRHTARMDDDPNQSVLASVDWANTTWPVLPNAPDSTALGLTGSGTTSSTQVVATWQDGYLS